MALFLGLLSLHLLILVEKIKSANIENNQIINSSSLENNLNQKLPQNYFTLLEFQLFEESLNLLDSGDCRRDLNLLLQGLKENLPWAIKIFDASARSQYGVASGIKYQLGHYDQCLEQQIESPTLKDITNLTTISPILSQYCLIEVNINSFVNVQKIASRKLLEIAERLTNSSVNNYPITSHWGVCVPASCGTSDLKLHLAHLLQRPNQINVSSDQCQVKRTHAIFYLPTDGKNHLQMLIYACVIMVFILLAVLSTIYHLYLINYKWSNQKFPNENKTKQTLTLILLSFSIIENTKKLFQASRDEWGLNPINGIKSLAMILILAGHSLTFIYSSPAYNVDFIDEKIKWPIFAFLSNSLLFVDIFLLLSGFLFCRLLLIELNRRQGKLNPFILYIARYIRLTPAYLAVIGFYMTWFSSIGNGPFWPNRIQKEQSRCQESWWLNILYINNYINTDKLCMFQSWYLAVDSQLFFVAPLIIYLLYRSKKNGVRLLSLLIFLSTLIPIIVTYLNKLDPTLMVYPDEVADLVSNNFYKDSYIKTHMRFSAYVIGLLTGYLVHEMQSKNLRISCWLVKLFWIISVIIGIASMFSICWFYSNSFNYLESSMYAGFHKLGWNLSVSWLLVSVTTIQHSGKLAKILSGRVFAPVSRLTYCAYLSNGIIELYHSSTMRNPTYMSYINLFNLTISHVLNTFILALVLCLLFESPIIAIERILLKTFSSSRKSRSTSDQERSHSLVNNFQISNSSIKKDILTPT